MSCGRHWCGQKVDGGVLCSLATIMPQWNNSREREKHRSCAILWNVRILECSLLDSNDGMLTGSCYTVPHLLVITLIVSTSSIIFTSLRRSGFQTGLAYSRCDLTIVRYNCSKVSPFVCPWPVVLFDRCQWFGYPYQMVGRLCFMWMTYLTLNSTIWLSQKRCPSTPESLYLMVLRWRKYTAWSISASCSLVIYVYQ